MRSTKQHETVMIVGSSLFGIEIVQHLTNQSSNLIWLVERPEDLDLVKNYKGKTIIGIPSSIEDLHCAGMAHSDIVLALTENDRVNLMVCDIARQIYDIQRTFAQITDRKLENLKTVFNCEVLLPIALAATKATDDLMKQGQLP